VLSLLVKAETLATNILRPLLCNKVEFSFDQVGQHISKWTDYFHKKLAFVQNFSVLVLENI
jgi:hypothetical protein